MDEMTESEPTLNSACCAGSSPYRPIGQFRVIWRICNRKFNVPIKAGQGPSNSTEFIQLAAAFPTNRAIPVRRLTIGSVVYNFYS